MDCSPLNTLPVELRLVIYEFALELPAPVEIQAYGPAAASIADSSDGITSLSSGNVRKVLPLLATCKQIRQEALPVFFSAAKVEFRMSAMVSFGEANTRKNCAASELAIKAWLSGMAVGLPYLQYVDLYFGTWILYTDEDDVMVDVLPDLLLSSYKMLLRDMGRVKLKVTITVEWLPDGSDFDFTMELAPSEKQQARRKFSRQLEDANTRCVAESLQIIGERNTGKYEELLAQDHELHMGSVAEHMERSKIIFNRFLDKFEAMDFSQSQITGEDHD